MGREKRGKKKFFGIFYFNLIDFYDKKGFSFCVSLFNLTLINKEY